MEDNQFYKPINLYLSGELSQKDEAEFNQRLNASEENRRAFARLQKLWLQLQPLEPNSIPEFEASWSRISGRPVTCPILEWKKRWRICSGTQRWPSNA